MYSREDRIKAVELWLKYAKSTKTVISELGYPSKTLMRIWYKDYIQEQETGIMHVRRRSAPKYTEQQRQTAIEHYLTHGRFIVRTIRALGFPSRELMFQWCRDLVPIQRKHSGNGVQFSQEQKKDAVIDLCSGRAARRKSPGNMA